MVVKQMTRHYRPIAPCLVHVWTFPVCALLLIPVRVLLLIHELPAVVCASAAASVYTEPEVLLSTATNAPMCYLGCLHTEECCTHTN